MVYPKNMNELLFESHGPASTSLWTPIGSATLPRVKKQNNNGLRATLHILGTQPCQSPSKSRLSSPMSGSEGLEGRRPLQNKPSMPSGKPGELNAKVYYPSVSFRDHDMKKALGLTIQRTTTVFIRTRQRLLDKP
jgi:hypothetical protein